MKLIRPAQLPDGNYFVGRFHLHVKDDRIMVCSRQHYTHNHEYIDQVMVDQVNENATILRLQKGKHSARAEKRVRRILTSTRPALLHVV